MEETNYNAKCSKCGYIYEADLIENECACPLCGNSDNTQEAEKLFKETFKDYFPEKKSTKRIILDFIIFGAAFIAFIAILYFLICLILGLTQG